MSPAAADQFETAAQVGFDQSAHDLNSQALCLGPVKAVWQADAVIVDFQTVFAL